MKIVVIMRDGVCEGVYSDDVSAEVQVFDRGFAEMVSEDPEQIEEALTEGLTEVY